MTAPEAGTLCQRAKSPPKRAKKRRESLGARVFLLPEYTVGTVVPVWSYSQSAGPRGKLYTGSRESGHVLQKWRPSPLTTRP